MVLARKLLLHIVIKSSLANPVPPPPKTTGRNNVNKKIYKTFRFSAVATWHELANERWLFIQDSNWSPKSTLPFLTVKRLRDGFSSVYLQSLWLEWPYPNT